MSQFCIGFNATHKFTFTDKDTAATSTALLIFLGTVIQDLIYKIKIEK